MGTFIGEFNRHQPTAGTEGEYDLITVQENIAKVLDVLTKLEILDGTLIEDIELEANTDKVVNHGLGREPRGWFVVEKNISGWAVGEVNPSDNRDKELILQAGGAQTISIWVF
jgi:hypothetical protein